jgi:flagellar basal-body rod protein FlgB
MFISGITERGATPALVATLAYTQARHKVIAENVANWGTPDYQAKRLDRREFEEALGRALDERRGDASKPFRVPTTEQFFTDSRGSLQVTPVTEPPENILFHDGSNMSIERQMADLADNAMMHELATTMLRGRFEGLRKAIRGRV